MAFGVPVFKLFWCSTPARAKDWFVVASDAEDARLFFASEEGFQASEVEAGLMTGLPGFRQQEAATWPSVELLAGVGEVLLREGARLPPAIADGLHRTRRPARR